MNHRADAGSFTALGREQHRMAAASLFLMLGVVADARRGGMFGWPLVVRAVLRRFLRERIAEMMRDRFLDLVVLRDDPHHEKEGHHGRDGIGISRFPGAAATCSHQAYPIVAVRGWE